jgi:predicted protein tyrosine phosphatase
VRSESSSQSNRGGDFHGLEGVEVSSAGTAPDADCVVSSDLIEWASDVMVMEQAQKKIVQSKFGDQLQGKRLVCLRIKDKYELMQPELVELLKARAMPLIRGK